MGFGMACNLLAKAHYEVIGYDVYPPSAQRFADRGGRIGASPGEVAERSDVLVCMAANADQINEILFNKNTGALKSRNLPSSRFNMAC